MGAVGVGSSGAYFAVAFSVMVRGFFFGDLLLFAGIAAGGPGMALSSYQFRVSINRVILRMESLASIRRRLVNDTPSMFRWTCGAKLLSAGWSYPKLEQRLPKLFAGCSKGQPCAASIDSTVEPGPLLNGSVIRDVSLGGVQLFLLRTASSIPRSCSAVGGLTT